MTAPGGPERSVAELFADLANETTFLIRKELELARAEVVRTVSRVTGGAVLLAVGAVVAAMALQALVACLILVGSRWLEPWLAALVVGGALLVIGAILVVIGRQRLALKGLAPRRTIETLRQDGRWAREQLHERL